MYTYKEFIDMTLDYAGADVTGEGLRYARQAVQHAYREVQQQRRWSWYTSQLRINTVAMQQTGTVEYDHTGGTYERMMTLTGSTWPSWVRSGTIVIGNIPYEVAEQKTSTVVVLSHSLNPGRDIASGTAYTLYQDTYLLPDDFTDIDNLCIVDQANNLEYVAMREWLIAQQASHTQGTPNLYAIRGAPDAACMAVSFYPAPDAVYAVNGGYRRKPKQLVVEDYNAGQVTLGASDTTVIGNGTTWTSSLIGSIMRFSESTTVLPTGRSGSDPYFLERVVMDVTDAGTLTIDNFLGTALTGVAYSISDPIDMDDVMIDLFRLECFKQMRIARRLAAMQEELVEYETAKGRAYEADSRFAGPRSEGSDRLWYPWLKSSRTSSEIV